jgi:hypothetical protein
VSSCISKITVGLTIIHGDIGIRYGEISAPAGFTALKLGVIRKSKVKIALGLDSKIGQRQG